MSNLKHVGDAQDGATPQVRPAAPLLGATVTADRVVGRDNLVEELWEILENQSIHLSAERRIGKTAVLNKMVEEVPDGWSVMKRTVEGISTPSELVNELVDGLGEHLSRHGRAFRRLERLYHGLGLDGLRLGPFTLPDVRENWKRALLHLLQDVQDSDQRVAVILDEFPNMVWKILKNPACGPSVAADLVDVLRAYRQDHPDGVKFVICGSIGFHLILRELRAQGAHRGRASNDLHTVILEPLEPGDAADLAEGEIRYLVEKGRLQVKPTVQALANAVAEAGNHLPFYIEHILALLQARHQPVTSKDVTAARTTLITDAHSRADLNNYRGRIHDYYPEGDKETCLAVLDALSDHAAGRTATHLAAELDVETETVRNALSLLEEDHYIVRAERTRGPDAWRFKYDLIRDWWRNRP